jgi:carbon-monoxide dehydrogenase medium subunit
MSRHPQEYHRPSNPAEALKLLDRPEIRALPLTGSPRPPALIDLEVDALVDLSQLNLAYVTFSDEIVFLGAQTSLQDIVESPLLGRIANGLLPEAARQAAHFGMRHLATLEGALLARESLPEIALVLLALDAQLVTCQGDGTVREMLLADYLDNASPSKALMIEARIPWKSGQRAGAALERTARTPRAAAIFAAAAMVEMENGRCRRARLALAPSGLSPARVASLAQKLEGLVITRADLQAVAGAVQAEVNPPADFQASADYRQAMAGVLARRALQTAWDRALAL